MRDELFLCEKQDPIPFFVNPDRMMGLPVGICYQQKGPQLIEASKPPEVYLGLGLPPLIEENGLMETREHQVLVSPRGLGQTLYEAWNNIRDQS